MKLTLKLKIFILRSWRKINMRRKGYKQSEVMRYLADTNN